MADDDVHVTRDADGAWRIDGDDRVLISNLTPTPPSPLDDAVERATGRRPKGYALVTGREVSGGRAVGGKRTAGVLRFRVRFD